MDPQGNPNQVDLDLERTRLLALTTSVNARIQQQEQQPDNEAAQTEWTGKDIYDYMQQNRTARFEKTAEGRRQFNLMKEYMKERNVSVFQGFGEALGSMVEELGGLGRAPSVLLSGDKSLGLSSVEALTRGVRDIATIVWQSEDPNSWAFNVKKWIKALDGDDDGDTDTQMDQYHVARNWNNRTYDYMEGKATALGDIFEDQKDFFKRSVDPVFATGLSWIATDIPEWILSGGVATAGSAIKAAQKGGLAQARAISKRQAMLASAVERVGRFGTEVGAATAQTVGRAIIKPFEMVYGARASMEAVAGRSAASIATNIATSEVVEAAATAAGQLNPAVGIFRSVGLEAIGEVLVAYGSELGDRALGVSRLDPLRAGLSPLEAVAANLGGATAGKLSKEAQNLAKGINYSLGWLPSMSSDAILEASRNGVLGGFLGYYHSEEAVGQGVAIGAAYGAGFGTIRHMLAYSHYHHRDQRVIKNFNEIGLPALARVAGTMTAEHAKNFYNHLMQMAKNTEGGTRMASVELASLTHLMLESANGNKGGAVQFHFGDLTTTEGKAALRERLVKEMGFSAEHADATVEAMEFSKGQYVEPLGMSYGDTQQKRVIIINSAKYEGMTVNHEIAHKVFRQASFNSDELDGQGIFTEKFLRRFFGDKRDGGILADDVADLLGTTYFALRGETFFRVNGYDANTGKPIFESYLGNRHYRALMNAEIKNKGFELGTEEALKYERENTVRVQQEAYANYSTGPGGGTKIKGWLDELRKGGNAPMDESVRFNLSELANEILAYSKGQSDLGLPVDYWAKNSGQKNMLQALGDHIGTKRHTRIIADMELAGVFIRKSHAAQTAGSGPLLTAEGKPFIETYAFDNGKVVRFEALDAFMKDLVAESVDFTEQAAHTYGPHRQSVIAKLSGKERLFDTVKEGMRMKPPHERERMATEEAKAAFAALDALPAADKQKVVLTDKGVMVKLEDLSQAGWDALKKSGVFTDIEFNQLYALANITKSNLEPSNLADLSRNNVMMCSYHGASYQVGRGATSRRLLNQDVPITHRVFTPLSVEMYFNNRNKDGTPARKEKGGIVVHALDILAENKRLVNMYSRPEIKQHWNSFTDFVQDFYQYVHNNSQEPALRKSSEDLFRPQFGDRAAAIRDIMFEAFGGRKPKDATYINTPGESYTPPGDNRLYPFHKMTFGEMFDIEVKPTRWNANSHEKQVAFPYSHKFGYDPQTRNNMVSGFVTAPKANGEYLRNRQGFEIHNVKGKFRMFDHFGNKIGDFADLKKAIKMADKLMSKIDEEQIVPAAASDVGHLPQDRAILASNMIEGLSSHITSRAEQKHGSLSSALDEILRITGLSSGIVGSAVVRGGTPGIRDVIPLSHLIGEDRLQALDPSTLAERPLDLSLPAVSGRKRGNFFSPELINIRFSDSNADPSVSLVSGGVSDFRSAVNGPSTSLSMSRVNINIPRGHVAELLKLTNGDKAKTMRILLTDISTAVGEIKAVVDKKIPRSMPSGGLAESVQFVSFITGGRDGPLKELGAENPIFSELEKRAKATVAQNSSLRHPNGSPTPLGNLRNGLRGIADTDATTAVIDLYPTTDESNEVAPYKNVDLLSTGMRDEQSNAFYSVKITEKSSEDFRKFLQNKGLTSLPQGLDKLLTWIDKAQEASLASSASGVGAIGASNLISFVKSLTPSEIEDLKYLFEETTDAQGRKTYLVEDEFSDTDPYGVVEWKEMGKDPKSSVAKIAGALHTVLSDNKIVDLPDYQRVINDASPAAIRAIRRRFFNAHSRSGSLRSKSLKTETGRRLAKVYDDAVTSMAESSDRSWVDSSVISVTEVDVATGEIVTGSGKAAFPVVLTRLTSKDPANAASIRELLTMEQIRSVLRNSTNADEIADAFLIHQMVSDKNLTVGHETLRNVGRNPHLAHLTGVDSDMAYVIPYIISKQAAIERGDFPPSFLTAATGGHGIHLNINSHLAEKMDMLLKSGYAEVRKNSEGAFEVVVMSDRASGFLENGMPDRSRLKFNMHFAVEEAVLNQMFPLGKGDMLGKATAGPPVVIPNPKTGAAMFRAQQGIARPGMVESYLITTGIRSALKQMAENSGPASKAAATYVRARLGNDASLFETIVQAVQQEIVGAEGSQIGYGSAILTHEMDRYGVHPSEWDLMRSSVALIAMRRLAENNMLPRRTFEYLGPLAKGTNPADLANYVVKRAVTVEPAYAEWIQSLAKLQMAYGASPQGYKFSMPAELDKTVKRVMNMATYGPDEPLKSMVQRFNKTGSVVAFEMSRSNMLVGSEAIRRMQAVRRNELIERGLLKQLRLGSGTTHLVYELSDDRAQLNLRRFGNRLANIALQHTGEDPADFAKLVLAKLGHDGYRKEIGDQIGAGQPARAYMPAPTAEQASAAIDRAIEQRYLEVMDKANAGPGGKPLVLEDVIDHPDLFEYYPNLRKIPVKFNNGYGGAWNLDTNHFELGILGLIRDEVANLSTFASGAPKTGRMQIISRLMDQVTPASRQFSYENSVRGILLHEIQHAVQTAERWSTPTPWVRAAIMGQEVRSFTLYADQYAAAEKMMGGKRTTKILANIDVSPDRFDKSVISDRLMRTWGTLQDIVSLDPNTSKFIPIATPEESVAALRGIIEAPKAVRLMNDAIPSLERYIHDLNVVAETQISVRNAAGDLASPELDSLRKGLEVLETSYQKLLAVKEDVLAGGSVHMAIEHAGRILDGIHNNFPLTMLDPQWSSVGTKQVYSAYNANIDVDARTIDVARRLARVAAGIEAGQVISPAKAQLIIVELMNDMADYFYSSSDTEVTARETANRALMSQAELEANPRKLDFFSPENAGMYELADWQVGAGRGPYTLQMIGGLAGSPEIASTSGPGGDLNHFAASIRLAARAALHGIHLRRISEAASAAGVIDFSSRGWVMEDGKLVYRISTGRLEGARPDAFDPVFDEITQASFVADQAGFSGSIQKSVQGTAFLGYISRDGKNITVEDVGRIYGANVAYENITDTESPVMNYLMKDEGPSEYVGGSIRNTLALAGLSDDAMRMANLDHVDTAFSGVTLSRYELLDLLATVHDVTLESTSLSAADKHSVSVSNATLIKDKAEAGRRLWSAAKNDDRTQRAANAVLNEIMGLSGHDTGMDIFRGEYTQGSAGGAMFMMQVVNAHLKFASSTVWEKFLKRMDDEQRKRFMLRVAERLGGVQHYPARGWEPGHHRAFVGLLQTIAMGGRGEAEQAARAKVNALNRHVAGLLIAVTPAAEKLWKKIETSKMRGEVDNLDAAFADVVADMVSGAMQGADVWNVHLSERGSGQTRYVSGLEQIYIGARVEPGRASSSVGITPLGAPVATMSQEGSGYTPGFYRNLTKTAEELGTAVPAMTTGGMPIHGTITGAAGDLYRQFATGTYVGSAFAGDMFGRQLDRLTDRGRAKEGDLPTMATKGIVTDSDTGPSSSINIVRRMLETSGIRAQYKTPDMTIHEGHGLYQTPSLKQKGAAVTTLEEPGPVPRDAEVPIEDVASVQPILRLHAASLAEIAAPFRNSNFTYGDISARAADLSLPMALMEFRNAGLGLLEASRQYLNFAEQLTKRHYTRVEGEQVAGIDVNFGLARTGDIIGSLDISEVTAFGDAVTVNELLVKAKAFHHLAHLINYRADNFGMMGMAPSFGSSITFSPYTWEHPRAGGPLEIMSPDERGFALPTSNTGMVRGLIDDKSVPGAKTMLITHVSSLAEPPTAAEVGLVDSAFTRDADKQKAEKAQTIIPFIRNVSFDLNMRGDTEGEYGEKRAIYRNSGSDALSRSPASTLDGQEGKQAPLTRTLADVVLPESESPILPEVVLGTGMFFDQAYYTQVGFGHRTLALAEAAAFYDKSNKKAGQLIATIRAHTDLATDIFDGLCKVPLEDVTPELAENMFRTVYRGRKIKWDPRILLFALPPKVEGMTTSQLKNRHFRIMARLIPDFEFALHEANNMAMTVMSSRHMRQTHTGQITLSPAETMGVVREAMKEGGAGFSADDARLYASHFINKDLRTTDGFIRYNNLVGDIFLEKTMIGWLGGRGEPFLGHLDDESKTQLILALRHAGKYTNPFSAFAEGARSRTPVKKTVFGDSGSEASEIGLRMRNMTDSIRHGHDGLHAAVAARLPYVIRAMMKRDGMSIRRPMVSAEGELRWNINDIYAKTGNYASDEPGMITRRPIAVQHTGNGYSFSDRSAVAGRRSELESGGNNGFGMIQEELLANENDGTFLAYSLRDPRGFGLYKDGETLEIYANRLGEAFSQSISMASSRNAISGRLVPASEGGMFSAMIQDVMTQDEILEGLEGHGVKPVVTVTPKVPRTSISESTARTALHDSIRSRIAAEGVDSVDIAPASSIVSRVLPDVLQKRFELAAGASVKPLHRAALFTSRGLTSAAKTMSRPYGEGQLSKVTRDRDALAARLPSIDLSGASAIGASLGGFANPFSLTGQPYSKGYSWNVQPDGSILINISGDHLGYKTGLLDDVWGFSLTEGVGFDPHSSALIPMRYDLHRDMSDILTRTKHSMADSFDPHDAAVERARILAGRDYDKRPLSEVRMQILRHSGFQEYHVMSQAGEVGAVGSSRLAAFDDPVNFRHDMIVKPDQTAAMIRGEVREEGRNNLPFYRQQLVAAGALGALQTASYLTIKIPAGATPEMIKAMVLSVHTDLAIQKAILGTGTTSPKVGLRSGYHLSYGKKESTGTGRRFAGRSAEEDALLQDTRGYAEIAADGPNMSRRNLEMAMQLDPKLVEDVEVLVGRIAANKSSYFLPETERALRLHGDTGASIATMFPGRPDLERFSWDAKMSRDIKVWKRTLPRGANPDTFFQHVVQFNSPVGMSVEGALSMGPNAIAFRTAADAEAFANRMSMQRSGSDLVRALSTGEAEIVSRPQDMASNLVVPAKVIDGRTVVWDTPGRNEAITPSDTVGLKIGDSQLAPGTDAKTARAMAAAIGKNKHVRFSAPPITLQMAMGLVTERDFKDLVTAKTNFGLPLGPARFASKAMQVITEGVLRANGAYRQFTELTGAEWLKLMKENGVSKDEIRQSGLGALFLESKGRKLSRLEVAEFFAHMYPVVVRNDFAVNDKLQAASKSYVHRGGKRETYVLASPDHVAVSIGNQMMGLSQLERRRQELLAWLNSEIEKGTPLDDPDVQAVKRALEGFDKVFDQVLAEFGDLPNPDVRRSASEKVQALKQLILGNITRPEGKIELSTLIQRKATDIRELSYQPYEQARLEINRMLSGEVLAGLHRDELGPMFSDLGPAIEHALTVKNSALFFSDEVARLARLNSMRDMQTPTGATTLPYFDNRALRSEIKEGISEGQGPRIGQYIGNDDYWHAHYVSGAAHSQQNLIVDYANTAEVEIKQFIEEKNSQLTGMPAGPDRDKLSGIVKSAQAVLAARMAQKALGENERTIGSGHFGAHIGGLFGPLGRYEIGHLRQSHVLATGRPTIEGMIRGVGGVYYSGKEATSPLVDPTAKSSAFGIEPVIEPLTVIEEVQSDAFQKLDEVSELTTDVGSTMLPVEEGDLSVGPRMEQAKKMQEKITKLQEAIDNGDEAIATKLLEEIAGVKSSSFINAVRRNAIESIDLVSRQYMVPQFPGLLRSTGRKVRMGDHLRRKLEALGMKFGEGEAKVSVYEFDFELLDAIGDFSNLDSHPTGERAAYVKRRLRENLASTFEDFGPNAASEITSFRNLESFDAAPSGVIFNAANTLAKKLAESTMGAAAQQSQPAMIGILSGLEAAANAAAAAGGGSTHLQKFIGTATRNMRNLHPVAQVQAAIAGVMATDPTLNAMLRQIVDDPESFDYEALAKRSVEIVRAKFADSKGVLSRSALTTLDKMLLMPAHDGPRSGGLIESETPLGQSISSHDMAAPLDRIERGLVRRDPVMLANALRELLNVAGTKALINNNALRPGQMANVDVTTHPHARLLLPFPGSKGDFFRMPGNKDYLTVTFQNAEEAAAIILEGHDNPDAVGGFRTHSRTEFHSIVYDSYVSFTPPYRGSMAGDMAKIVAHHLSNYERIGESVAQLEAMKKTYAEQTKGLPEPAKKPNMAVSRSTPFIDESLTWYKSVTINHSIIESINRGQRSVGLLDGAYQMTRGGTMQKSNNIRIVVGPGRVNYGLRTAIPGGSTTLNRVRNVMLALQTLDGEIAWKPDGFTMTVMRSAGEEDVFTHNGYRATRATHVVRELMMLAAEKFGIEMVSKLVGGEERLLKYATGQNRDYTLPADSTFELRQDDYSSQPNLGPDGKPSKFDGRARGLKPYQQMAIESPLFVIPDGWSQGSVPVGYTLNYGLHQNAINQLFTGVAKKVTNVFNLDAFERPSVTTVGDEIVVYDKAGREVIRTKVTEMASPKTLEAVREAVLKNSKYVGGNIYLKTFLKEWGPAGGYVDARIATRGLVTNVIAGAELNSQVMRASGVSFPKGAGTYANPVDAAGLRQQQRLLDMGLIAPNQAADQVGEVESVPGIMEYQKMGGSARNSWESTETDEIMRAVLRIQNTDHAAAGLGMTPTMILGDAPMFTVMTHTPLTRTPAELKAYTDKIKSGVFLQMLTGTDAMARKDSKSMRRVARYLAAAGHIPRFRMEELENEQP